ncbi:adenylate kinase [uncultured Chryseobacterium sp.]|uniref:adenylate kinase n=1 Tax=uncultured Chryseobacterium sp. TaxID=259322 RepID=UPI0025DE247A|nr:adenylate kinase [uncultured Chryseobacterium sp.]
MVPLEYLGTRICIIGPSSGGKSTLAKALGEKLQVEVCHLDQLAHLPGTDWKPRARDLFRKDHNRFLSENNVWIIEGNYSFLMQERFGAATAVIWLDFKVTGSVLRYIIRSLKNSDSRPGNLEGATRQFSWPLIRYIMFRAPKSRGKYRELITSSNVRLLYLNSFRELKAYYRFWKLKR